MNEKKRPVGRPLTGKTKILISLNPGLLQTIDDKAAINRMSRSKFIEMMLARALGE